MADISEIKFHMVSPEHIKKIATIEIANSEVYDADAYPIEGGVMDPHLGVIDPGMRCKTCGSKSGECLGHFGYINLSKPVYNILFIKKIKEVLVLTCQECSKLLFDKENVKNRTYDLNKIKPATKCPNCGYNNKKIKFERPQSFTCDGDRITPEQIREQFEKISDEDLSILKMNGGRPEWMILTILPVPPITTRPSITLEDGERSEDDLTHKLVDVIRINQRLANNLEIGAPEFILDDLWELLQYHVTTYFNNEISGLPPARHRSGRQLKTLSQRLKSKSGRFRLNLTGKRVDFSARTVVSPDQNIGINEVGIPELIAKVLTIPIKITERNFKEMKECVERGPEKINGANYTIRPDGLRKKINDLTKEFILEELQPGFIVERHIKDGDIVLFNRQPSLHRMSIMAHRVKVMPYKTFRLNLTVCKPYNADFDGDEMNVHVPQTAEARAEAEQLMLVEENIRSPRFGGPIIGADQDYISGCYLLTKDDTKIDKKTFAQIILKLKLYNSNKIDMTKETYTGKELFSVILPDGFNHRFKSKDGSDVIIENGKLIKGSIDEKAISSYGGKIINKIDLEYGHSVAVRFIEHITIISIEYLMKRGFTLSLSEEEISEEQQKDIKKIQNKFSAEIDKTIETYKKGKLETLPGQTLKESLESNIIIKTSNMMSETQEMLSKNLADNDGVVMAKTGARGSIQNFTFMAGYIGQELSGGSRIFRGYKNRCLPFFKENDLSLKAHGFVESSFRKGLNPTEFFFEAMKGREGIMDSSLKTKISGYMQRRLVNAMQDYLVKEDKTVRDSNDEIIQFVAGEDGIDPAKSDSGGIINLKEV